MASANDSKLGGATVRRHRPISAYPLFPAFVALWFGALLGLSSVAVGVANLERAVAAAQLELLLPAAAPPLGTTARTLIALALALGGGVFGFALGHLIARRHRSVPDAPPVSVRVRDTHPDAPVRRPISAHEEFGEPAEHDAETSSEMQALRASAEDAVYDAEEDDLALPAFLTDDLPQPSSESSAAEPQAEAFGLPVGEGAERIASADLEALSPVELLERMAIAMQQRLDRRAAETGIPGQAPEPPTSSVAKFPVAHGPSEPDETEKALRDALATLHRMSGAA